MYRIEPAYCLFKMNMASSLEQDLKKKLGRSKAEKVFRPWWDEVEDTLLNTLVVLGNVFNFFLEGT